VVKSPSFSTGVGLVQYAANQHATTSRNVNPPARPGMFGRLRRVLSSAF
jgi:hypothetical protein